MWMGQEAEAKDGSGRERKQGQRAGKLLWFLNFERDPHEAARSLVDYQQKPHRKIPETISVSYRLMLPALPRGIAALDAGSLTSA